MASATDLKRAGGRDARASLADAIDQDDGNRAADLVAGILGVVSSGKSARARKLRAEAEELECFAEELRQLRRRILRDVREDDIETVAELWGYDDILDDLFGAVTKRTPARSQGSHDA